MHHPMTPCVLRWKFCVRRKVSSSIPCGLVCDACLIQYTLRLLRFDKFHFHGFIVSEMTRIYILQLLEGIGAIKKTTDQGAYQDSVAAPLGREHDDKIAAQEDGLEDDSGNNIDDAPGDLQGVLSAIERVIILLPLCKHPIA